VNFSKPKVVRIFVNGEYGDVRNDRTPFRTITVRPSFKSLTSVYSLCARELEWHVLGRKVEVLYSCRGEEITSLEQIDDGGALVASSGDRFIVPRPNSVLHRIVTELSPAPSGR
jgi:hypothetical protein